MFFKNIISSNVFLYKIWFNLYLRKKNRSLKLPQADDVFYFDGFPRSGNSYTIGLIERAYPELKNRSSHHLHSIAGIKLALKKGLKTFIIIRQPKDAIVSYLFVKNSNNSISSKLISNIIDQYITYNEFVYENRNKINVIKFDDVINNGEKAILEFGLLFQLNSNDNVNWIIQDYNSRMKNFQNIQPVKFSSMPNSERKKFREVNKEAVINSNNFEKAVDIYNKLSQYDFLNKIKK